jgi:hypothetical protein
MPAIGHVQKQQDGTFTGQLKMISLRFDLPIRQDKSIRLWRVGKRSERTSSLDSRFCIERRLLAKTDVRALHAK